MAKNSYDTENISAPLMFSLDQNFPNPFNPSTVIKYSLPEDQFVSLEIFNSIGQKVKTLVNEMQTAGRYNITFNADGLASGIYIYKIKAGSFEKTMKMTLLK